MNRKGAGMMGAVVVGLIAGAAPAVAQTDYYNTDHGRPLRIEDAHPVERHAFELQLAPLRLERGPGARYHWEVEPSLAYGVLPRTQVELGLPVRAEDLGAGGGSAGIAGLDLSALHNLNAETRTFPAFALGLNVALPVGVYAGDETLTTLRAIATRTFSFARFHLNAETTLGGDDAPEAVEGSRWLAGVAVDRALPLKSLLLMGDVFAEQPLHSGAALAWTAETGFRYQTSPQFNLDFGLGRRLTGDDRAWFLTFGVAHAFALPALMGVR